MFSRSKSKKTKKKALKNAKGARAEATKQARAARGDAAKQAKKGRRDAVKQAKNARSALVGSAGSAGQRARATGGSLAHSVSDAVGPRAEAAAGTVRDRTAVARERAVAGFDRGVDGAVPRAKQGVASVGPKVDQARDAIVDDLLPRIQEMLGSVQVAKDDLLSRQDGPVAVVTGAPKKQRRKGGVLISLGLLAAVGAAVSYFLSQKSDSDDTDPWAGSNDRPIGGAPGVDTQVRESGATEEPPLKEDVVGHDEHSDTGTAAPGDGAGVDSEATDTVADGTPTTDTGLSSDDEPEVRMLEVDDVPGTDEDTRADGEDKPQT